MQQFLHEPFSALHSISLSELRKILPLNVSYLYIELKPARHPKRFTSFKHRVLRNPFNRSIFVYFLKWRIYQFIFRDPIQQRLILHPPQYTPHAEILKEILGNFLSRKYKKLPKVFLYTHYTCSSRMYAQLLTHPIYSIYTPTYLLRLVDQIYYTYTFQIYYGVYICSKCGLYVAKYRKE